MISLVLPFPPSTNGMYPTRGRKRVLSQAGRTYHDTVVMLARHQVPAAVRTAWPMLGRIRLAIDVLPPDQRRRDLSNLIKCLEDSLTLAGVWADDSQVDELVVLRSTTTAGGMVRVRIDTIERRPA